MAARAALGCAGLRWAGPEDRGGIEHLALRPANKLSPLNIHEEEQNMEILEQCAAGSNLLLPQLRRQREAAGGGGGGVGGRGGGGGGDITLHFPATYIPSELYSVVRGNKGMKAVEWR